MSYDTKANKSAKKMIADYYSRLGLRPPKNPRQAEQAKQQAETRMRKQGLTAKMTNAGVKIEKIKGTDSADGK